MMQLLPSPASPLMTMPTIASTRQFWCWTRRVNSVGRFPWCRFPVSSLGDRRSRLGCTGLALGLFLGIGLSGVGQAVAAEGIPSTAARGRKFPTVFWPVVDARWETGVVDPAEWAQATASGRLESALFGCTRNGGTRFHEGIDIGPVAPRTRQGEATDTVVAILPGRVLGVNAIAGQSGYGRYVVIEHEGLDVAIYSLYAHLASIANGLAAGDMVSAGQPLGVMGRSASYSIPTSRAHLHFEVGLRKSDAFQSWFDRQNLGSPNHFGLHNGVNLTGFDPLPFFHAARAGQLTTARDYLQSLPVAFTLRVATNRVPDFVRRYPALVSLARDHQDPLHELTGLSGEERQGEGSALFELADSADATHRLLQSAGVSREALWRQLEARFAFSRLVAWEIDFTWYGLPIRWIPRTAAEVPPANLGDVAVLYADQTVFEGACRDTIEFRRNGDLQIGRVLRSDLQILFGFE